LRHLLTHLVVFSWPPCARSGAAQVTGKAKVEYFFDPTLALPPDADSPTHSAAASRTPGKKRHTVLSPDEGDDAVLFASPHLFMPCSILKDLETADGGGDDAAAVPGDGEIPALVKTADGQLHKIRDRTRLVPLAAPEDYAGLPDVLHLPAVSEASLLHALRVRYRRDEIYTSAGPILMSVNPYKALALPGTGEDLYSEARMLLYHAATAAHASDALPCHLFQVADRAYRSLLESVRSADAAPRLEEEDASIVLEKDGARKRRQRVVRNQSVVIR
jgi:hypothetical protein